jgi:hypothetical protein
MRRWFGSIVVALAVSVGGCAEQSALEDITEGSDDVVSAAQLAGSYSDGKGRLATLSLLQVRSEGRTTNQYEAERIVQCARPPCPTVTVKGKWFTRDGVLTFFPDGGGSETFRTTLLDRTLSLFDGNGVLVTQLTRQLPSPEGIAASLAKHGVPQMRTEIDDNEVNAQARRPGVEVAFREAFDLALELFLTDESALLANALHFEEDLRDECGMKADLVRCLANAPRTSVSLMPRGETAPFGESPDEAWVITFFVDDFTDHGYFAIVPQKRDQAPHIYAFN